MIDTPRGKGLDALGPEIAVIGVADMQEIHIRLQRNDELKDWSMEINGRLHEHVPDEGLTDLVEAALIVAAKPTGRDSHEPFQWLSGESLKWSVETRPLRRASHVVVSSFPCSW